LSRGEFSASALVERLHVYAQTLGIFDIAVEIVELLAIDLGFGEKNVPLMALLLALVGALGALLRFKALAKLRIITKAERKCFERGAWSL
jgi:hypothetical protein